MFRIKVKNKNTGDISLAWEDFNCSTQSTCLYSDIDGTNVLNIDEYEAVPDEPNGIPFNMFGIECGKGWIPLIKPIVEYIDNYNNGKNEEDKIYINQIKEKWACYDEKTEVLTMNGWKYFKDVSYDDFIMTLNHSNGCMEYQTPTDIISYEYNYDMYYMRGDMVDLLVTPNHNLYASGGNRDEFGLYRTDALFGRNKSFMVCGGKWNGKDTRYPSVPNKSKANEYLSEIAKKVNSKFSDGIPLFVKGFPKSKILKFISDVYGEKGVFTTESKKVCDDICELILKAGKSFVVNEKKGKKVKYSVELYSNKTVDSKYGYSEGYEKYSGNVYCVTVPNHIIYVRRNGKGCWCGNCLRIYVSSGTDELYSMIDKAEEESANMCEECGSRENVGVTMGYYRTLCHDCIKKMSDYQNRVYTWRNYGDNNVYYINPNEEDKLISTFEEYKKEMP